MYTSALSALLPQLADYASPRIEAMIQADVRQPLLLDATRTASRT